MLREGLLFAVDYNVQKLEVETDAEIFLTMLGSTDEKYHHELSIVLKDIACLMTQFSFLVVKHIPRAHNKLAHCMAQYVIGVAVVHKMFLNRYGVPG